MSRRGLAAVRSRCLTSIGHRATALPGSNRCLTVKSMPDRNRGMGWAPARGALGGGASGSESMPDHDWVGTPGATGMLGGGPPAADPSVTPGRCLTTIAHLDWTPGDGPPRPQSMPDHDWVGACGGGPSGPESMPDHDSCTIRPLPGPGRCLTTTGRRTRLGEPGRGPACSAARRGWSRISGGRAAVRSDTVRQEVSGAGSRRPLATPGNAGDVSACGKGRGGVRDASPRPMGDPRTDLAGTTLCPAEATPPATVAPPAEPVPSGRASSPPALR